MDRSTVSELLNLTPVTIAMNDGQKITVDNQEMIWVDDIAAHVIYRAADGKLRTRVLALVCMCSIEPVAA